MANIDYNRFRKPYNKRKNYAKNFYTRTDYLNRSDQMVLPVKRSHYFDSSELSSNPAVSVTKSQSETVKGILINKFKAVIKKIIKLNKNKQILKLRRQNRIVLRQIWRSPITIKFVHIYKGLVKSARRRIKIIIKPVVKELSPYIKLINSKLDPIINRIGRKRVKWACYGLLSTLVAVVIAVGLIALINNLINSSYNLPVNELALIGQPDSNLMSQLTYDAKAHAYYLSKSSISTTSSETPSSLSDAISIGGSSKNKAKYSLELPTNAGQGITTYDNTSNLSFTMIPLFSTYSAKQVSGHTVYPIGIDGPKAVYTVKANGVQEDVVYAQAPKGSIKLQYRLKLPSTLQARMMSGGNIGIYSASPYLFGNITYGSSADQQKVQLAREKSAKNNLVFVLPAPKIITASGLLPTNSNQQVSLSLNGNIVTVSANGLGDINGPISIDPSVIVTAASDFMTNGNNEGDITYDTTNNQITEAGLTGGTIGSWTATTSFSTSGPTMPSREGFAAVAYNGYLYVMGGAAAGASGDCTTTNNFNFCKGVFYASITNGTIGSWTATTSFSTSSPTMPARFGFGAAVYNGYLYVMGGVAAASSGDCTTTFVVVSTYYLCNGVFYTPINNTNGTIGSWTATTTFPSNMPARADPVFSPGTQSPLNVVAYNGYLYVLGGVATSTSGNDCTTGSGNFYFCNGVFYASFNADGTIGSWTATTAFSSSNPTMPARDGFGAVAYNGYLYVMGGTTINSSGDCTTAGSDGGVGGFSYVCNGVFYAPINTNGTIGSWAATTSFSSSNPTMPARGYMSSIINNGYLYILGGISGTTSSGDCTTSNYLCNGVFYAPVYANGMIGSWAATTTFTATSMPARAGLDSVAYNGYIYTMGGESGVANTGDCTASTSGGYMCNGVFSAPINSAGIISSWMTASNSLLTATVYAGSFAYNGYIYEIGGGTTTVDYAPINASGNIGTWQATTSLNANSSGAGVFEYNGYVYDEANDEYAPINSNGTIGSWANSTLSTSGAGTFAYNGYVYEVGGGTTSAVVEYAPINSNGTIGSFTATTSLPTGTDDASTIEYNGYIYELGGATAASGAYPVSTVFYAPINANGTVGTWNTTSSLLTTTWALSTVAYNGFIYELGGNTSNAVGACTSVVTYAPINTNGTLGSWVTAPSLTDCEYNASTAVYNGYIYFLGGDPVFATNEVLYAEINNGGPGTLSTWTQDISATFPSNMPARTGFGTAAYNGYLYVVGGVSSASSGDCTASGYYCNGVFYAPISNSGTLGTWTADTTLSTGAFTNARAYLGVVAYNGYLYIIGGGASSSGTITYNVAGSGNWTAPSGVTSVTAQAWGGGGGGGFGVTGSSAGGGGGGGEYASEQTLAVTPGNSYAYTVGSGGAGATASNTTGGNGTSSSFTGKTVTVTANGGSGANTIGASGGTGSTNTIHYNGGLGNGGMYRFSTYSGGGGGGSGGEYSVGNSGTGTIGAVSVTGGGPGGSGGASTTGNTPVSGPGGGGGGGGDLTGGAGYSGQITISWAPTITYNDVQYATINSNGSLSAPSVCAGGLASGNSIWCETTAFTTARQGLQVVAYDGYLYVMGGQASSNTGGCIGAVDYCNDVQYDSINANGSIGSTWTDDTTLSNGAFTTARDNFAATAYNGNLYIMGGLSPYVTYDSDIQYVALNSNGSLSEPTNCSSLASGNSNWCATTYLPTARQGLSITTYNGDLYIMGGQSNISSEDCITTTILCNGVYYAPINNNGGIGNWLTTNYFTSSSMPARDFFGSVAYNGYIYLMGGLTDTSSGDCTAASDYCNGVFVAGLQSIPRVGYYSDLINLTSPYNSAWSTNVNWSSSSTVLPQALYQAGTVVYNGYIYEIGGCNTSCTNNPMGLSTSFYYASISSNGTIGTWNTTTTPTGYWYNGVTAFAYNGYLYIATGYTNEPGYGLLGSGPSFLSTQINSNGTLGTWGIAASTSPADGASFYSIVVSNGYIYSLGGLYFKEKLSTDIPYSETYETAVYYATIGSGTIGTWNTTTSLPIALDNTTSVINNNYIYVIGGCTADSGIGVNANTCTSFSSTVYYNTIYSNGALGSTWSTTTALPTALDTATSVINNGYLYEIGGYSSSGEVSTVYSALLNPSNGTIGSWNTAPALSQALDQASTVVYNGNLYELGGYNSSGNGVTTDYTGTLANLDVSPTQIVVNGINSGNPGIGEIGVPGTGGISVQYAEAGYSCVTFDSLSALDTGRATQLANPFTFLPYTNSCGVATNLSSYVWLHFMLDDSQTATFPDVSGNHTSVTDYTYTVYYHPDSYNRLRGGASFSNGSPQTLDTIP
jgi:hypothetical protein